MHADLQLSLPAPIDARYRDAMERLRELDAIARLWAHDTALWPDTPGARDLIATRLDWLEAPAILAGQLAAISEAHTRAIREGVTHIVLLGMGGSSLAPDVMVRVAGTASGAGAGTGRLALRMLDSVSPAAIRRACTDMAHALVVVASKSGSTIEPTVLAANARRLMEEACGAPWADRFVAVTDPATHLARTASELGYRDVWLNPPDIGGRYSALSLFGLVPAGLAGVQVDTVLASGAAMAARCRHSDLSDNPGAQLGAFLAVCAAAGRTALTLVLPSRLEPFGLWIEQLVAESTGKGGVGILPVLAEPIRTSYGRDRCAVAVDLPGAPADASTLTALAAAAVPIAHIGLGGPDDLGGEFFRWEFATAVCGLLMGVNPFDQPDVQGAKTATEALLAEYGRTRALPVPKRRWASLPGAVFGSSAAAEGDLTTLLTAPDASYVAILTYADPDDVDIARSLGRLRARLMARTAVPVTIGYGPRYLHSTGQLHKGGPAGGRFLIVTLQPPVDLAIPGAPYSFGTLQLAQARADLAALDRAGRHAALVEVTGDASTLESTLAGLLL
ncbi:MAG: glucose-6-phosphate isomerase [Vicinamibacterales bacterium]